MDKINSNKLLVGVVCIQTLILVCLGMLTFSTMVANSVLRADIQTTNNQLAEVKAELEEQKKPRLRLGQPPFAKF